MSHPAPGISYRIFCGNTDIDGTVCGVKTDCWINFNDNTQVWYAAESPAKTLLALLDELDPDLLFITGIFSYAYNIVPLFRGRAKRKILSVRGMLHPGALSQKRMKKKIFLLLMKLRGVSKKISFHATDTDEAGFVKDIFGEQAKVFVAGNYGRRIEVQQSLEKIPGELRLVTIALVSPMKNHLLVLRALSNCAEKINYAICGAIKDAGYWGLCGEQIAALPKNIHVDYIGEVAPENIPAVLAANHVFIMPSKSENFGHAIYEALSAGRPVITGMNTPWNGLLESAAGKNVATDETAIKEAVQFFTAMRNEEYAGFCAGATIYAQQRTNDENTAAQYLTIFAE